MMDKLRETDPNSRVTIEIPQNDEPGLTREISVFSQPADDQNDMPSRSRSNSDVFTGTGDLKFSVYPNEMKKSINQNKPYMNQD